MKILIADDLPETRIVLRSIFIRLGYDVVEATDGLEAWEKVKDQGISLVISDWLMPGMDGVDLCKKIRAEIRDHYIYFILLTSLKDKEQLVKGMEAGADDFISKPFNPEELKVRIRAGERIIALETDLETKNRTLSEYNTKLEKDLKAAAELQKSILPPDRAEIHGLRFESVFMPSTFVAGDIYNYFPLDETHIGFYILDVAGHGVSSAMLSFTLHRMISVDASQNLGMIRKHDPVLGFLIKSPSAVLQELNKNFTDSVNAMQYFTMLYGVIDLESGKVTFSSAGHPSMVYVNARDGDVRECEIKSFPIGMFAEASYDDKVIEYHPGDVIYLFSDGFRDCIIDENPSGKEPFPQMVTGWKNSPLAELIKAMVGNPDNKSFQDDITIVRITF